MDSVALIIIVCVLLIAFPLVALALIGGKFAVLESAVIDAPMDAVRKYILDFRRWNEWSPWTMHDKDVALEFSESPQVSEKGGWFTWKSRMVGEGKLTHTDLSQPHFIGQHLKFIKPFKSQADVGWSFEEKPGGTLVTWSMQSSMPFLLRFLIPMMKRGISKDYRIGLLRMNQNLSSSAPKFKIEFDGEVNHPSVWAVFNSWKGPLASLKDAFAKGYCVVFDRLKNEGLQQNGKCFAAYRMSLRRELSVEMAVPIENGKTVEGAKEFAGGRYLQASYTGSYDHMELAWHAAFGHFRMKKCKMDRSRPGLEIYENDAESTPKDELLTRICLPLR